MTVALGTFEEHRAMISRPRIPAISIWWDDTTTRDISIIWRTIAEEASRWRGNDPRVSIEGMPTDRKLFWTAFSQHHTSKLLPVVAEFVDQSPTPGTAIDLGCGNSSAVDLLLSRGWRVTAVDNAPGILPPLAARHSKFIQTGQLEIIDADITDFTLPTPVDLVVAADVFPYVNPAKFQATWTKVHDVFLKEKGHLVGSLFCTSFEIPTSVLNMMEDMGAWLLPDKRMVESLLMDAGYEIQTCKDDTTHQEDSAWRTRVQFIAQKR